MRFKLYLLWTEELVILDTKNGSKFFLVDYEPDILHQASGFDLNVNHKLDSEAVVILKEITDTCNRVSKLFESPSRQGFSSNIIGNLLDTFTPSLPVLIAVASAYLAYVHQDSARLSTLLAVLSTCATFSSCLVQDLLKKFILSISSLKSQGDVS